MTLLAVDSAMYFFRLLLNDHRPVSSENRWLARFVYLVKCRQRVESLRVTTTNTVFGVENLKNNGIRQVFI
jgi:hypothetical protein